MALEAPALLTARLAAPLLKRTPFDLPELEAWQLRPKPGPAPKLSTGERNSLRKAGRQRYKQANAIAAKDMQAEVHHSSPLDFANIFPRADPNRLANLWALPPKAHKIASREWDLFTQGLKGRMPTQAEVMAQKLRIDRMVELYIRRPGAPRPRTPPPPKPPG